MAEGGREFARIDTDEDLLYCPVCMEKFEDPRALPCLHTFCYKCLEQLNSSGCSKRGVLKCPLCAEEHFIPDKGVNGFRKDFRIKNLIGQHRGDDAEVLPRSISQEYASNINSDKCTCSTHPQELLLYHCESSSCQLDICEKCWSSDHNTHNVKLLSKKVNDAKGLVEEQMMKSIDQVNAHINLLINGKETMVDQYTDVRREIQKRFVDVQEKLNNAFQEKCEELDEAKKLQEKNMTDELQNLCTLQDTFIQLRDSLEKESVPCTKKAFEKYEDMLEKMRKLSEDLSQWRLNYTKPQVLAPTELNFESVVKKNLEISFTDDNLGDKLVQSEAVKDSSIDEKGKMEEKTEDSKPVEMYKLPARKSTPSKSWALQQGVNVLLGVQKGFRLFQGVPKGLIKGIQKGFHAGSESSPVKPSPCTAVAHEISEIIGLKWKGFLVKRATNIQSMAFSRNGVLFVAGKNQLFGYNSLISPPEKLYERQLPEDEYVNTTAVSTSALNEEDFLVTVNAKRKTATFYPLQDRDCPGDAPIMSIPMHKRANRIIASSGHFICYPFHKGKEVYAAVSIVKDQTFSCLKELHIPFKSGRVRSLCMDICEHGNPVIICANAYIPGQSEKSEVAVLAITSDRLLWQVTFNDLDPNAENFDLRSIVCEKDNVFVLNNKTNKVYNVSQSGKCVRNLCLMETPPMFNFYAPSNICIDKKRKFLYIAHHKDVVSRFSYV